MMPGRPDGWKVALIALLFGMQVGEVAVALMGFPTSFVGWTLAGLAALLALMFAASHPLVRPAGLAIFGAIVGGLLLLYAYGGHIFL